MTLRVVDGVPSLRRKKYGHAIFDAFHAALLAAEASEGSAHGRGTARSDSPARRLRVTHFSIQRNHFHLVVEAESALVLSRGMQGIATRLARRLNPRMGRRGRFFADRYHARQLETPLEVRRVLQYVLNNIRKHSTRGEGGPPGDWADPFSSVDYFDGFRRLPSGRRPRAEFVLGRGPPVHAPLTWLLRKGWRAHGLLVLWHTPGPRRPCAGATARRVPAGGVSRG